MPKQWMQSDFIVNEVSNLVSRSARRAMKKSSSAHMHTPPDFSQSITTKPFALYLHFPFCSAACRYCIFRKTTHLEKMDRYIGALCREIEYYGQLPYIHNRSVHSIHLGGGTPSLFSPSQINKVLNTVSTHLNIHSSAQITLEANPDSINENNVREFMHSGIQRFSVGVQSLNDATLQQMGRSHRRDDTIHTLARLLAAGAGNINVDLMYGFDNQSTTDVLSDVKRISALGVPHISVFPLISIQRGKRSFRQRHTRMNHRRQMYREVQQYLFSEHFYQYSSEDFAKASQYESVYQKDAWQFPGIEVAGLGAGSLGSMNGCYYSNQPSVTRYIEQMEQPRLSMIRFANASDTQRMERKLMLGAKYLIIRREDFERTFNTSPEAAVGRLLRRFQRLGIWTVDQDGIHTTEGGLHIISEIWSELILANLADAARRLPF